MTYANKVLEELINSIDISPSAYETAKKRYRDIGNWLGRADSTLKTREPHIAPQGSFRIGTVTKPINENENYDLDLICKLNNGLSKKTISQKNLKESVGHEVKLYRKARGIEEKVKEKHVCWSLIYKDELGFYIDVVPCLPEQSSSKDYIRESMVHSGYSSQLSKKVSDLAVAITNNEASNYSIITDKWTISNPEGYAKWFEERMKTSEKFLNSRIISERVASIDELPIYKWKTPLQRAVQVLKRHRDIMFKDAPKYKPVSLIITTLAAHSYRGNNDLHDTISNILNRMRMFINDNTPRIPNPVNPSEDLARCWSLPNGEGKAFETHFEQWLQQAQRDFNYISQKGNSYLVKEQLAEKFGVSTSSGFLYNQKTTKPRPKRHEIVKPAKPWKKN